MSIFGKVGSFFEAIGKEFEKLFGKSSTFEQAVSATIKYVAPLVETIISLTAGGPAAAAVSAIVNQIETDLATVSTVVQAATAAPGSTATATIQTALSSVQSNLSAILADADVKNSAKASDITATVNLISGEISAALSGIPAAPAS